MTGKEALKEIRLVRVYIDEFGCAVPLKKVKEYKIIENELDELTKYKRAFEILKDLVIFDKKNQAVANGTSIIDLSKEECELLEELMKGEQ